MSNSTVSSVNSAALPNIGHRFATSQNTPRAHGRDDDNEGRSQGLNLFSALLQALVSAATQAATGSATSAAGSSTPTTGAAAAAASGTTTSTATTPSSTATTPSSTAGSSLPQDLGAFLHDLFHALRQAGRQEWEGRHLEPLSSSTSASSQTSSTASTGSAGTSGTSSTGTTATGTPAGSGVSSYRDHGVIGALQQLIQDLTNTQVVSGASAGAPGSGVSQHVVTSLNSAFQRLIADLGGTSSASGSQSDTTALKSFLQGFLQDLQNGNASGGSGNLINAAA